MYKNEKEVKIKSFDELTKLVSVRSWNEVTEKIRRIKTSKINLDKIESIVSYDILENIGCLFIIKDRYNTELIKCTEEFSLLERCYRRKPYLAYFIELEKNQHLEFDASMYKVLSDLVLFIRIKDSNKNKIKPFKFHENSIDKPFIIGGKEFSPFDAVKQNVRDPHFVERIHPSHYNFNSGNKDREMMDYLEKTYDKTRKIDSDLFKVSLDINSMKCKLDMLNKK